MILMLILVIAATIFINLSCCSKSKREPHLDRAIITMPNGTVDTLIDYTLWVRTDTHDDIRDIVIQSVKNGRGSDKNKRDA